MWAPVTAKAGLKTAAKAVDGLLRHDVCCVMLAHNSGGSLCCEPSAEACKYQHSGECVVRNVVYRLTDHSNLS